MANPSISAHPQARLEPVEDAPAKLSTWERFSFSCTHAATAWLLAILSLKGLYRFGVIFGTLEWAINFTRRRRFKKALRMILGRKPTRSERRTLCRSFFVRSRCDKLLYLILDRIPREQAAALLTIQDREEFDKALDRGRGLYLALAHHGAHHILGMLLAINGYKTAGVRDRNEGGMRRFVQDRFAQRRPELQTTRWLFADTYPRDIYRCFQDGLILGSAMDINRVRLAHQRLEEVAIFGETRGFLSGPLRIAIRCQTPVMQCFIISERFFHYRLEIVETLVDPDRDETDDEAVSRAMQSYAANVEQYLREYPDHLTRI